MLSAVGENRLMPKPEVDSILINASSGHTRTNRSWVLSRMLRDFDHWRPRVCDEVEQDKLDELLEANKQSSKPRDEDEIRVGLRVTVWDCHSASGRGSGDAIYWVGMLVSALQLGIAAVPWGLYGEWFTFFVTAAGTLLAYASGSLPQWWDEKVGVRHMKPTAPIKDVILTEGNGAKDAILILGCNSGMDLEALAAPQRELRSPWSTRILTIVLAILWTALLISVAGWEQHTWFILGVGTIGILHNVLVAGMKRQPHAFGINLVYQCTIVEGKVMEVLRLVEEAYPRAGAAMRDTFFPGKLRPRERLLWEYAERRAEKWEERASGQSVDAKSDAWPMPPLASPLGKKDDTDIPASGPYPRSNSGNNSNSVAAPINNTPAPGGKTANQAIDVYSQAV